MTIKEIQSRIFAETGLKTSVRKGTGSLKGFYAIRPMYQNGQYASYPHEWLQPFKSSLNLQYLSFFTVQGIDIQAADLTDTESKQYKRERKPKPIEEQKVRQWGSKNSQLRLDKAITRNAKKMQKGNTARYY